MQVRYQDILRVWREADAIPEIGHAWLFDHLMPIGGDPDGPVFEGWTLLPALAAQTERLRLGLLVTSNRFRPPAELAAALDNGGIHADQPVIAYCGGGISATVDLFALWLTGRDDARLYDGSLTEWSAHPDLPLITG